MNKQTRTRRRQDYFKQKDGDPPPLVAEAVRVVRFEEVDPLMIVWHGRYASYLEDGRAAFGRRYGLSYLDMYHNGFLAPIVKLHIDYFEPLQFPQEFTITTRLHWSEAAKMNFSYVLTNGHKRVVAAAYTVQILTDLERNALLIRPAMLEEFCNSWREGRLT